MYVVDGVTVNYERLNETVEETTVLTYQCDSGLSLTGPNTITCTNAGVWSTDPREIMCVAPTDGELINFYCTGTCNDFMLIFIHVQQLEINCQS